MCTNNAINSNYESKGLIAVRWQANLFTPIYMQFSFLWLFVNKCVFFCHYWHAPMHSTNGFNLLDTKAKINFSVDVLDSYWTSKCYSNAATTGVAYAAIIFFTPFLDEDKKQRLVAVEAHLCSQGPVFPRLIWHIRNTWKSVLCSPV